MSNAGEAWKKTATAWSRLWIELRILVAIYLLDWALDVMPKDARRAALAFALKPWLQAMHDTYERPN